MMTASSSLELLHSIQLDMLVKFDRFCSENNLRYFLDSGTALGVVRHSGFIPWDDDVDVAMPREDYERLVELGSAALPDNLFLQTYETDLNYMCPFGKIRLGNSFFPDIDVERMKYQGIYIDVFPYDRIPSNRIRASLRIRISRLLWFVCTFSRRKYPGKNILLKTVSLLAHRLSNEGKLKLYKYYDKFCGKFNMKDTGFWTCYCWNMSQHSFYVFNDGELFPTEVVSFEGKELKGVHDAHSYLTKMYGNYHVLPPEETRKNHLKGRTFSIDLQ